MSTNLAEITGIEMKHGTPSWTADRVVSFELTEDHRHLAVVEECDQFFGIDLDAVALDKLIAWLTEQRAQMVEGP